MTLRALLLQKKTLRMLFSRGFSTTYLRGFDNPLALCYDFHMLQMYIPRQALYSYPGAACAPWP